MNHLSEEQLVDRYYVVDERVGESHLQECTECRTRFRELKETLDSWRGLAGQVKSDTYGAEVWARLAPQLSRTRTTRGRRRQWIPALAAMLTLILAGGWWMEHKPGAPLVRSRDRVLLITLSEHLEQAQIVLTDLAHSRPGAALSSEERERARNLLAENRLLRQTAVRLDDKPDAALLDDLERVLLNVANAPAEDGAEDLKGLQDSLSRDGLLWRLRVTSGNARGKVQQL